MPTETLPKATINFWTLIFYNKVTIFHTLKILVPLTPRLLLCLPICCRYPQLIMYGVWRIHCLNVVWDQFHWQSLPAAVFLNVTQIMVWRNSYQKALATLNFTQGWTSTFWSKSPHCELQVQRLSTSDHHPWFTMKRKCNTLQVSFSVLCLQGTALLLTPWDNLYRIVLPYNSFLLLTMVSSYLKPGGVTSKTWRVSWC